MRSYVVFILSAVIVGAAVGWVLQRGRICMNSAFRDIIFISDLTVFRAYVLALTVAVAGTNLLEDFALVRDLNRQEFAPLANVIGGYIFGIGMVFGGGCASGIWYRIGEGRFSSWITVLGFVSGIFITSEGALSKLNLFLRNYQVWIADNGIRLLTSKNVEELWARHIDLYPLTIYNLLGVNKWIVIAVLGAIAVVFIARGDFSRATNGYSWYISGGVLGVIVTAAWWASWYWSGKARGVSFTGPTNELFRWVYFGESPTWSVFMLLGLLGGSFISARGLMECKLRTSTLASEMIKAFFGGIIMGIGSIIAGGCNIGHGLTGLSTLAVSSVVSIVFMILGNWTTVYFLFIRSDE
ncbi:inner membrane protein [Candidatus Magnetobacterium bavaricum]|uniref:Inner membrane protein n=1 Tax=Candidatus Magnetobacterium bavaricum TaxID=29290 RepID=A0A0F3H3C8_9BACT|nr:inner membrane protein [Candidatus Magnetobacterium bavaricum]